MAGGGSYSSELNDLADSELDLDLDWGCERGGSTADIVLLSPFSSERSSSLGIRSITITFVASFEGASTQNEGYRRASQLRSMEGTSERHWPCEGNSVLTTWQSVSQELFCLPAQAYRSSSSGCCWNPEFPPNVPDPPEAPVKDSPPSGNLNLNVEPNDRDCCMFCAKSSYLRIS